MEDLKVLNLKFRGSSNQRLIDVPATLEKGIVVEWTDPAVEILRETIPVKEP
jgi:anaerobic ribonucleoside-triphosphate reductase activating protein